MFLPVLEVHRLHLFRYVSYHDGDMVAMESLELELRKETYAGGNNESIKCDVNDYQEDGLSIEIR